MFLAAFSTDTYMLSLGTQLIISNQNKAFFAVLTLSSTDKLKKFLQLYIDDSLHAKKRLDVATFATNMNFKLLF